MKPDCGPNKVGALTEVCDRKGSIAIAVWAATVVISTVPFAPTNEPVPPKIVPGKLGGNNGALTNGLGLSSGKKGLGLIAFCWVAGTGAKEEKAVTWSRGLNVYPTPL
jgi:hypothetical protein